MSLPQPDENHVDRILAETAKHTLRPRRRSRAEVVAEVLQYVVNEFSYVDTSSKDGEYLIDCNKVKKLISDLRRDGSDEPIYPP